MRLVIFACQQIGVDFLKYVKSLPDVELCLVITYELPLDKTYGYHSVLDFCENAGIKAINPKSIDRDLITDIENISPDIIFSIYYRKIFPSSLINIPPLGCINIHPSKLPFYKGPVPTAWAIENGEKEFGITVHLIDSKIDTGDILFQEIFPINSEETGFELYTRAMKLGASLICKNFNSIINPNRKLVKQKGIGSYYGKKTNRTTLNWKNTTEKVKNLVRVHAKPFNPIEARLFNKYFLINKVSYYELEIPLQGPGRIMKVLQNENFVVSCTDGYVLVEDYEIVPKLANVEKNIYLRVGNRFE